MEKNNNNTRIDFFIRKLPGKGHMLFEILDNLICITFLVVICVFAGKLVGSNMNALSAAMKVPLAVNYVAILVGCIMMIIFYIMHLGIDIQKFRGIDMTSVEEELNR